MTAQAIHVAEQWIAQAARDLQAAKLLAASQFFEWGSYAAQQAAEKAIKAVRHALAIDTNAKNEQTHRLIQLAGPLMEVCPGLLPDDAALGTVTQHEVDGRYPGLRTKAYLAPHAAYDEPTAFYAVLVAEYVVARCERLTRDLQAFWAARAT